MDKHKLLATKALKYTHRALSLFNLRTISLATELSKETGVRRWEILRFLLTKSNESARMVSLKEKRS